MCYSSGVGYISGVGGREVVRSLSLTSSTGSTPVLCVEVVKPKRILLLLPVVVGNTALRWRKHMRGSTWLMEGSVCERL